MHESKISKRGQTTLPKAVRDALGLKSLLQKSDPSRGPAVSTLKYLKTAENRPLKGAIDPFGARSTSSNVQNRLSTPRLALLQQARRGSCALGALPTRNGPRSAYSAESAPHSAIGSQCPYGRERPPSARRLTDSRRIQGFPRVEFLGLCSDSTQDWNRLLPS